MYVYATYMYTNQETNIHVYKSAHKWVCVYEYIYIHISIPVHTYRYVFMYTCIYNKNIYAYT